MKEKISKRFKETFGEPPLLVRSPGRINLIGEHTDYNQGWVLPAAIDKNIYLGIGRRNDDKICLVSEDYRDTHEASLRDLQPSGKLWPDYLLGVADQFLKDGKSLKGFNVLFGGDIPQGAGLSSSAALECSVAYGLNMLFDLDYTPLYLALRAQAAENEFVGAKVGLMDQFASVFGKKQQLIKLDCATYDYTYIPFTAKDVKIVLLDSRVTHSHTTSAYNERRQQCEKGVSLVAGKVPGISSLRKVTANMLDEYVKPADETLYRRCLYVVSEIERVQLACEDLLKNDLEQFGRRMFETHQGLKEDYEVSCPEIDLLVDLAAGQTGVLGARMMGGGFGGCTINLVKTRAADELVETARRRYKDDTGKELKAYTANIEDGTQHYEVPLNT